MKRYLIAISLLIIWGCANRISPTGGPRDEDPPELLRSIPENGQRNFKTLEMEFEFNEFITLKSLKEQLIITPRLESEYDFKFKKRTAYLEFEEPFADSTTYTLNFREGIVDITENLPADNLQIAFSTGNLLDTLEVYGTVVDMFTVQPKENVTVGLYTIDDTLDVFSGPPYYFAKTDDEGHYHFRNIKDGSYKIYAFEDGNKNLTCQSANEAYAFLDKPIVLDTAFTADTLRLEQMNIDTLKMTRVRPAGKYFNVLANKYLVNARLQASNDSTLFYHFNDEHKGLVVYNTFPIKDSLEVYLNISDSLQQIVRDTFYLQFPETSRSPNEFELNLTELQASLETRIIKGEISFTKPIREIRLDSIEIFYDSLIQYNLKENFQYVLDTLNNEMTFSVIAPKALIDSISPSKPSPDTSTQIKSKTSRVKPKLKLPKGTFYSVEQDTSSIIEKDLTFTDASSTGIITGTITSQSTSYTIQLLDQRYEIVQELGPGKSYKFSNIKPGEYFIRILIDADNNGIWDHSDIRINRMADPILIYRDETGNNKTAVRANWEINVNLNF